MYPWNPPTWTPPEGDYLNHLCRLPRVPVRAPSKAKITATFPDLDKIAVRVVRGLLRGEIHPCAVSSAAETWARRCYHRPPWRDAAMYAVDQILGTYGVEGWPDPDDMRGGVSYCNTGETYNATVCLIDDSDGPRWYLGSWGDLAERGVCGT